MNAKQVPVRPIGQTRLNTRALEWLLLGALLIVATVYQRYHYVVDLIGGALFFLLCIWTARPLYHFTRDTLQTLERNFPRDV